MLSSKHHIKRGNTLYSINKSINESINQLVHPSIYPSINQLSNFLIKQCVIVNLGFVIMYWSISTGKYMYIEASYPRKPGEIAKLVVTVPNNGNQSCLSFYYHMYGTSVGTLNVYSGNIKVFTATGNQGNDWLKMAANLYLDGVVSEILPCWYTCINVSRELLISKINFRNCCKLCL